MSMTSLRHTAQTPEIRARQEEVNMAKVNPFHSKLPSADAYHDNNSCTVGNNIESYNRVPGTGNLPKCYYCKQLS